MAESHASRSIEAIENDAIIEAVMEAISNLSGDDVFSTAAGPQLDELSTRTIFDGIEANPDGIFQSKDGRRFEATATVYVTLNYGGRSDDVSIPDSYPALVTGEIRPDGSIQIDHVGVDTSSFFADE